MDGPERGREPDKISKAEAGRQPESGGEFRHFLLHHFLALADGLFHRAEDEVLEQFDILHGD